ncbi:type IV / VI secretion system protein, DotU family [Methylocella silvestris BL2]|uniref:Type IV / VI secretion system protein, DotU family n=1 Tax=Methylocella silvestris (strain DSM 15510 / CIP 108128 / LMG 27833 / NCIMB 13906 / BL2) TaxID=395965 RepID=B8EIG4_METSB|nr:type VI secretion system protein TssL, long form [Methylocella silvestris]ACK51283.1 type IV / VI secretion system protein, DotU family [Methylocella silvestris BL2]
MNEKDPPDSLGRRDNRTIIVPNPGGRRPEAARPSPAYAPPPSGAPYVPAQPGAAPVWPSHPSHGAEASPGDEWIKGRAAAAQTPDRIVRDIPIDDLLVPNENPLLRAAGPLLLLLGRLRVAQLQASPASLMGQVAEAVAFFDKEIRATGVPPQQAETAKYILCATADDIVQNIPTEDRHVWTQYSMLSRFFGERIGGVRFFSELDKAKTDPLNNYDLLELIYDCLALGFQGVHRSSATGAVSLQQIQRDLYELLRRVRPRVDRELSPHWRGQSLPRGVMRARIPFWAIASLAALCLFGLFITLRMLLTGAADVAAADLNGLIGRGDLKLVRHNFAPPPKPPEPPPGKLTQLQRIRLALAPEIAAKKVDATQTATKIRIIVGDLVLFPSGQANVKPQFEPIAKRIAQTLEKEPGAITIVGHTDNVKLQATSPFDSNWTLSMARAKAVAAVLKPGLSEPARIEVDGKADEQPIAPNDTPAGRAQNRRVEIMLARSD